MISLYAVRGKRTFSSQNKNFGCPHFWDPRVFVSFPFCLWAGILISNIAGHGAFERSGRHARLAELKAAGNVECVSGDTHTLSLAGNFQENAVGGEEKQRNDKKPCRARLSLPGLPGAHIPAALQ